MPSIIKPIDKVVRELKRTVLYVTFNLPHRTSDNPEKWVERQQLIQWLDEHDITYHECGNVADTSVMESYQGQLYFDTPYDANDPEYIQLCDYLEDMEGNLKIPGIYFWYMPVIAAMQNAHHHEPGFWDKWAENF